MPIKRNYSDIVQAGRTRIEKNTPVNNFNSQSITKSFLDIHAIESENIYDNLEVLNNSIDPTKSTGIDLDKWGFLLGKRRSDSVTPADYSTTNFYFYIDPKLNMTISTLIKKLYTYNERNILVTNGYLNVDDSGEPLSLIIKAGTIVQTFDNLISYSTISDINLANEETYVGIIATSPGPEFNIESNSLVANSLYQIPELRKISQYIKNSNRYPIQNGKYSLSDEEYLYTITTAKSALTSNELSIIQAVSSVPGIRDILYEKNKYGNGTVNIVLEGISPLISTGLINAVKEKIQQVSSSGDTIYVTAPTYYGIEVKFSIVTSINTFTDQTLIQQAKTNVIQYINDLPIGGKIIWNELISQIISIDGIDDVIPQEFKYGMYDSFNKINKNQVVLKFQNQQAPYGIKWYCDSGLCQICVA